MRLTALGVLLGLAGCAATAPAGSGTPTTPSQTQLASTASPSGAASTPSPRPTEASGAATPSLVVPFDDYPHEAPDLEGLLPTEVRGQRLLTWSTRGRSYFELTGLLSPEELAALEAELAAFGLAVDDFAYAHAGRTSDDDPPYSVTVLEIRNVVPADLPLGFGVLEAAPTDDVTGKPLAEEEYFERIEVGGKMVWRGSERVFIDTPSARGLPYVYDTETSRFTVLTDDEGWAADTLRQLP